MTETDVSVDQEPVPVPPIPEPETKPTPTVAKQRVFVGTGLFWGLVVGVLLAVAVVILAMTVPAAAQALVDPIPETIALACRVRRLVWQSSVLSIDVKGLFLAPAPLSLVTLRMTVVAADWPLLAAAYRTRGALRIVDDVLELAADDGRAAPESEFSKQLRESAPADRRALLSAHILASASAVMGLAPVWEQGPDHACRAEV